MIPINEDFEYLEEDNVLFEDETSKTYNLNLDSNNVLGYTNNLESVIQSVYKILGTERYQNMIYSDDYGIELENLIGEPVSYVYPELKRRIEEALMQDERIEYLDEFEFACVGGVVTCSFTIHSEFGDIEAEKEVAI